MKLKPEALLLLLLVLSRGRRAAAPSQGGMGNWTPPPGTDPLPVIPLPANPLERKE